MAIGQLFDYRRHLAPTATLGVLLPEPPSEDVLDLLRELKIRVVVRTAGGFSAAVAAVNPPGAPAPRPLAVRDPQRLDVPRVELVVEQHVHRAVRAGRAGCAARPARGCGCRRARALLRARSRTGPGCSPGGVGAGREHVEQQRGEVGLPRAGAGGERDQQRA